MKKIIVFISLLFISFFGSNVYAITEEEARKAIVDYAYFVYNYKKDDFKYVVPDKVKFQDVVNGYYTHDGAYGLDCNAFASFIVYNAFYANSISGIFQNFGRVAGNAVNGWSAHSQYYNSQMYRLREGETIQSAVRRFDLESILKPGDLIGLVAYKNSTYESKTKADKGSHIMVYVGNGNYIHNAGIIKMGNISRISMATLVGSTFEGETHGSISVLRITNYASLPSSILNKIRYFDGKGNTIYYNPDGTPYSTTTLDNNSTIIENHSNSYTKDYTQKDSRDNYDYQKDIKKASKIIGMVLLIIKITIPSILIITSIITLAKVITYGDDITKAVKLLIVKFFVAAFIFFIPTIVATIIRIVNPNDGWSDYSKCIANLISCK